ncbi:MAG: glycerophosphodiester phosphodiesterase [Acidimicrobiales bacterium]
MRVSGARGEDATEPWMVRRVLAYAHRGGAREGPSSTIAAMRGALAAGVHALELDVHASADGVLVCCHDDTVDRTTDGHGSIAELTFAELSGLDAAYWFVPGREVAPGLEAASYPLRGRAREDPEYRIPSLSAVLEAFPGILLNLDIKRTEPDVLPYEAGLAELLELHGRRDDVIVVSFSDHALARFTAVSPHVSTAAGAMATGAFWQAVQEGRRPPDLPHVALQVPVTMGGEVVADGALVSAAHEAGMAVHVWTVDDPAEMRRLAALGVDGIMSDLPSLLVAELERLGVSFQGAGR